MPGVDTLGVRARSSPARVAVASSVGNAVEMYDFLIYGTASAVVFGPLFFPTGDPLIGLLLAFASFGAGFLARPLGGVVIGHYGDRLGRRAMLVLTLGATGICTALIGLLPTYAAIGLWAPAALVTLRVAQGFFLGGETAGAVLMAVEHAPPHRHGWYGGWVFLGSPTGYFLSTGAFALSAAISGDSFHTWGWRIPFLLSVVLVAIGLYVRLRLGESPEFERTRTEQGVARRPVVEVLRTSWRVVLLGGGVYLGFNAFIFVLATFLIGYGKQELGLPPSVMLNGGLIGSAGQIVAILVFAWLSDRVGRLPVMLGGGLFITVYAFPLFWLLETRSEPVVLVAMAVGFVGSGAVFGPLAAYLAELFAARVRYSGLSLGLQAGAVAGGGLSPFIATALLGLDRGASWPISLYLVVLAAVTVACLVKLGEPRHRSQRRQDLGGTTSVA
ncbi:MFS transporter [Longimycelium tulufanense]|nr:MFS transporter [Longimycelium tulufanense]